MHRILRQTVELSIGTQAEAFGVQDRLATAMREGKATALERVFDRLTGGKVLCVDRMELDLGVIRGEGWLEAFFQRLADAAERTLEGGDAGGSGGAAAPRGERPRGTVEHVREASHADRRFEALAAFLISGRVPWWSDLATGAGWVDRETAALPPAARRRLIALGAQRPAALKRLLVHLTDDRIETVLAHSSPPELWGWMAAVCREIEAHMDLEPSRLWDWRAGYWQSLFRCADQEWRAIDEAVVRSWVEIIVRMDPRAAAAMRNTAPVIAPSLPKQWQRAFMRAMQAQPAQRDPEGRRSGVAPSEADARPQAPKLPASSERPGRHATPEPRSGPRGDPGRVEHDDRISDVAADDIVVSGAGVVLLHPFLAELFARLGLIEDGRFVEEDARHRAVHLLGYLAFGTSRAQESDLVLAKLLCGMPFDAVLVPVHLAAGDIEAADALLAAVMTHWAALKTASAPWLREQFFLRDGKLHPVDAGWRLLVETRAQDVLLGRLPWGIGVVALPWLEGVLHVSWRD